jgi:hypothetical protein
MGLRPSEAWGLSRMESVPLQIVNSSAKAVRRELDCILQEDSARPEM